MKELDRDWANYIVSIYEDLFKDIWSKVSSIVGEMALEMIIKISIKKLLPIYTFLEYVEVSMNGIYFGKLKNNINNFSCMDIKKGFQALVTEVLSIFAVMWGDVILKELSPRLKKAERQLSNLYQ